MIVAQELCWSSLCRSGFGVHAAGATEGRLIVDAWLLAFGWRMCSGGCSGL
jgi:hypothetical protein